MPPQGTGLALVSHALEPHPPSLGTVLRGWLLVSFPNLSFLCFRSFGTYLVPPPRDAGGGFDHQAPLRRGQSRTPAPKGARGREQAGPAHPAQSTCRAPERSCFLGKAGCEWDDSGQAPSANPNARRARPHSHPAEMFPGAAPPALRAGGSCRELHQPHKPRFRKTPEVFSYSQEQLLG